jgi:hypothetical protein
MKVNIVGNEDEKTTKVYYINLYHNSEEATLGAGQYRPIIYSSPSKYHSKDVALGEGGCGMEYICTLRIEE